MINGKLLNITIPERPDKNENKDYALAVFIWKEKSKEDLQNQRNVKEGNRYLLPIKIEQCQPELRTRIKGTSGYEEVVTAQDGVNIIGII